MRDAVFRPRKSSELPIASTLFFTHCFRAAAFSRKGRRGAKDPVLPTLMFTTYLGHLLSFSLTVAQSYDRMKALKGNSPFYSVFIFQLIKAQL